MSQKVEILNFFYKNWDIATLKIDPYKYYLI